MLRKTDKQLKQEVLRELKWDMRVGWAQVDVTVEEGVVTLTGIVPSYAVKRAAQAAAHRITGVLDVANDLEVKATPMRTDTEIARAVRNALEWDALIPDERIESTVTDGWVTLDGTVSSLRQKEDAERAIRRLSGVTGINNLIAIEPPKVDQEVLREDIEAALERRADREAERFRIEIKGGQVDLWGCVHSWQEKRAVLGSIINSPGVQAINDHLRVDPYF